VENGGPFTSVAFGTVDGHAVLAGGGESGQIWLWKLGSEHPETQWPVGNSGPITSLAIGGVDQRVLLAGGGPNGVWIWDLTAGDKVGTRLGGYQGEGRSLAFGEFSGQTVLACGSADGVTLWDPVAGNRIRNHNVGRSGPITSVGFGRHESGRTLLASGGRDGVLLWDALPRNGNGGQFMGRLGIGTSVAFGTGPDGHPLVAAGDESGASLWDLNTGTRRARVAGERVTAVAVGTVAGRFQLAVGDTNGVRTCEPLSGGTATRRPGNGGAITALAIGTTSDDRALLAAGDEAGVVHWELNNGRPYGKQLGGHHGLVTSVAFGSTGSGRPLLAAGGETGVLLWDAVSKEPVDKPAGATGPVTALAFGTTSGGETLLAAGTRSGQIWLWNAATRDLVGDPQGSHGNPIVALAFGTTADGDEVLASTDGGTIDIWAVLGREDHPAAPDPPPATGLRTEQLAVRDDPADRDGLNRGPLVTHLHGILGQLTGNGGADDERRGSAVIHIDGRWGSGKTTLVNLLRRQLDGREPVPEDLRAHQLSTPIVVAYDAWRECAVAPEWWSLATAINRAIRAERAGVARLAMTAVGTVLRVLRSRPALVSLVLLLAALAARIVGVWREAGVVSAWLTALTAIAAAGLAAGRVLFWTSPAFARLYARADDNPLGEIATIVARLRRWAPRAGSASRLADTVLGVWIIAVGLVAGYVLVRQGSARASAGGTAGWLGRHWLSGVATALVVLVVGTGWRWRNPRRPNGSGTAATADRLPGGTSPQGYPAGLAVLAAVGFVTWFVASSVLSPRTTVLTWHPELWAVGAIIVGAAGHLYWSTRDRERPRRPVVLVIDDLDRCGADRTVKVLETVHTLLRQEGRPQLFRTWRKPARLIVLVLADGRWIRTAFETSYGAFASLGDKVHGLGADFLQKLFDHTVLVPSLSAEQVSRMLNRITHAEPAPVDRGPATDPPTSAEAEDEPAGTRDDAAAGQPRDAVPGAAALATTPSETARRVEHLLTRYSEFMPANPRLIKRIANIWGMLGAVQLSLGRTLPEDHVARAAIMYVRFPAEVETLLSCRTLVGVEVAQPVKDLLTTADGIRISTAAIAECFGRQRVPALAGVDRAAANGSASAEESD
jgi:WD40 repeat protein